MRSYNQYCGLALALDVIGERWSLLIVRELLEGRRRFNELLDGLPGMALAGVARDLGGWRQSEYRDLRDVPAAAPAAPTQLLAVPYFAWANRDGGGMRVWIPVTD